MANELIPYLCGGTFLAQVLRARFPITTAVDHISSLKECLPEREVFRRLISIFRLADFYEDTILKTYTNYFKSCSKSLESYTQFSDNDLRRNIVSLYAVCWT